MNKAQKYTTERMIRGSWEAEILLSGSALALLWTSYDQFILLFEELELISPSGFFLGVVLLLVAYPFLVLSFLTSFGLATHLLCRAYWLAVIGLVKKAGHKDIQIHRTQKPPFSPLRISTRSLKQRVIQLDAMSSSVFSYTFLFTVLGFGYILVQVLLILPIHWMLLFSLPDWLLQGNPNSSLEIRVEKSSYQGSVWLQRSLILGIYFLLSQGFFLLYILDNLGNNRLRKVPVLRWVLFPLFRLVDRLRFRPIVQPLIELLKSQWGWRKRLFFLLLVFALAVLAIWRFNARSIPHYPIVDYFSTWNKNQKKNVQDRVLRQSFYLDEHRQEEVHYRCAIPSKTISSNFLEVHIEGDAIRPYEALFKESGSLNNYLNRYVKVRIDDKVYKHNEFHLYQRNSSDQIVLYYLLMLDISDFPPGSHRLHLHFSPNKRRTYDELHIPFWIDRPLGDRLP